MLETMYHQGGHQQASYSGNRSGNPNQNTGNFPYKCYSCGLRGHKKNQNILKEENNVMLLKKTLFL